MFIERLEDGNEPTLPYSAETRHLHYLRSLSHFVPLYNNPSADETPLTILNYCLPISCATAPLKHSMYAVVDAFK